jgi:hypothetical protein
LVTACAAAMREPLLRQCPGSGTTSGLCSPAATAACEPLGNAAYYDNDDDVLSVLSLHLHINHEVIRVSPKEK